MEKQFEVDEVKVVVSGENLSEEIVATAKEIVANRWQFDNVRKSVPYIKKVNALQEAAEKGKIGLIEFFTLKTDLQKERENNFANFDVASARQFTESVEDDYAQKFKVTFTVGDSDLEERALMSNLQAYRKPLPFTDSELTKCTLKGYVIKEKQRGGSPFITDEKELKAWLPTLDLTNDLKAVADMIDGAKQYFEKWNGKFVTDVAEKLRSAFLSVIPESQVDFEKAAADPSMSPSGTIVGEQTADVRLAVVLNELADEAYMATQRMEQEKGESFFASLKKQLFNRHEGILLVPDDLKEETRDL